MKRSLLYGEVPAVLASLPEANTQVSPLVPNSVRLADLEPGFYHDLTMRAPAGTIERKHDIALALRALAPNSEFTILAHKDKGGSRLAKELNAFGLTVYDNPKRHHRICTGKVSAHLEGLDQAIAAGAMQVAPKTGLMGQPGMFSWDRIDPGTALLLEHLPDFFGRGADFGCGTGILSLAVLRASKVKSLTGYDVDRRAIEACALNIKDPRFKPFWSDLRARGCAETNLDFVVTNPPFHDAGAEDQNLGIAFIQVAASALRPGGALWLTANRHLPYEAILTNLFKTVAVKAQGNSYKIFEAIK